jgi:hypothetical protein
LPYGACIKGLAAGLVLCLRSSSLGQARDIQKAIDELPAAGGTLELLSGRYVQRAPLNLREKRNVRLVGAGPATELFFELAPRYAGMPLIDLTGAQRCELSYLKITGTGPIKPSVALLLARSRQDGDSAGCHRFDSLIISIDCTIANVVSYGSEVNTWTHCCFYNSYRGGGNYITGRENHEGVRSPFGPVAGGSDVCHTFDNCIWGAYGRSGSEVNIKIHQRTGWFLVRGGFMSNKSFDRHQPDQGGRAGLQIGGPSPGVKCEQIVLDGLEAETYGARHAIEITGPTFGLTVRNCLLQSLESAIHVGAQLEDSVFQQNTLDAGMALYDWPSDSRAQVTVAATCAGNVFDLRWRRLGRLARDKAAGDESIRPERALIVRGDKSVLFARNEIHLQRTADLVIAPGVDAQNNEVRAEP